MLQALKISRTLIDDKELEVRTVAKRILASRLFHAGQYDESCGCLEIINCRKRKSRRLAEHCDIISHGKEI